MARKKIIKVEKLFYKNILKGISFDVKEGDIFAVMGHNGAGKTTLFKCLLGFYRTGKRFLPEGISVGYLPEEINFPGYMKVEEVVKISGHLHSLSEVVKKNEIFDIKNFMGKKVNKLSKGERKKVALYLTFFHNPDVVFLDEPTDGLDPVLRNKLKNFLKEYAGGGKTVLISSHVLTELEQVATSYIIIKRGRIVKKEEDLIGASTKNYLIKVKNLESTINRLGHLKSVIEFSHDFLLVKDGSFLPEVVRILVEDENLINVENEKFSFEKVYLENEFN